MYVDGVGVMVDTARAACSTIIDANKARLDIDSVDISFDTMPGEDLRFPDNHFTHSFTNQGIVFFKDGEKGAKEIYRTLKHGGTAIVTTWKYIPYVSIIQAGQKVATPGRRCSSYPSPRSDKTHRISRRRCVMQTLQMSRSMSR